jgi:KUP system potassium uptake protein
MTWLRGVRSSQSHEMMHSPRLIDFVQKLTTLKPYRSKGASVCLTSDEQIAPMALVLMAERMHAIQTKVICLNVKIEEVPHVPEDQRHSMQDMGQGIYVIILKYGYRDQINLPNDLAALFPTDTTIDDYGYLINRWSIEVAHGAGWAVWRKRLFALLMRNATPQARMFAMPPDRVIEIGTRLIL